jgi:phage terminase large subunit
MNCFPKSANMKQRGIEINFRPYPKQELAYNYLMDNTTRFVGYGGAGNGGKTYLMAYWITLMCIAYPGTGWGLCRKNITKLKATTLLTLFKVFRECNIQDERDYKYRQHPDIITFNNGSQIFLIDLQYNPSDPLFTDLGGYELTGAAIDESVELIPTAITMLNTRINRRLNAKFKLKGKLLETFNPAKNHVYTRYYRPFIKNELKPEYKFIKALPTDNLSDGVQDWIDGIMAENDQTTIQRLIYGNFEYDDDPAALIKHDKIVDCFSNLHVPSGKGFITCDLARLGGDRIVIVEWYGWRGFIRAFKKQGLDVTSADIEKIRQRMQIGVSEVLVDEDGMGGGVVDFMKYKGFVNNSRPLPAPEGGFDATTGKKVPENYDNLKSQCSYRLANRINNNGLYLQCENEEIKELVVQELGQIKQKKMDSDAKKSILPKDKVKEFLGRSPDFADALMMREWFELKPQFVVTADSI